MVLRLETEEEIKAFLEYDQRPLTDEEIKLNDEALEFYLEMTRKNDK